VIGSLSTVHRWASGSRTNSAHSDALTVLERQTLAMFSAGMNRIEIAHSLQRAPKTISNALTSAKEKLGARSLAEAAAIFVGRSLGPGDALSGPSVNVKGMVPFRLV
jgi:DNA-binding CsgD family transcriptional regulator